MLDSSNLSVQLYTLRERLATEPGAVFTDLAAMGFANVEPFGLTDFVDQLAVGLPKCGLKAPTAHQMMLAFPERGLEAPDLNQVWDAANRVGVQTVIAPASSMTMWTTHDGIAGLADQLNELAALAAKEGLSVGYHNHWWEVEAPFEEGTGLDILAAHLAPEVVLEVDTYWAYVGGADVPALLGRLGERVIALHLKDGDGSRDNKKQVAAGQGVIPILDFVAAAPAMKYGVIELDDSEGDMTVAVRDSFNYLNGK